MTLGESGVVTALVNTYNYGHFVGEAIESVVQQDFPLERLEILVVDDGSTDDTRDVVARFGNRVRYLHKPNGGQASAFNRGLQEAHGEFIALLDADDKWHATKIRRVMQEFERHPEAGMVYHPFRYWDEGTGKQWDDPSFPGVSGNVPQIKDGLLRYGDVSTSGMVLRRTAWEKLAPIPEELTILADSYLAYLIIFVAPVVAIAECLTTMRLHDRNNFNFEATDRSRLERRHRCWSDAVSAIASWLAQNRFDTRRPELAAYLKRYKLVEEDLRFLLQPPGRAEFFRHLRDYETLYAPLWSARYRLFRIATALAAGLLGYGAFHSLRDSYRRSGRMLRLRETLFRAAGNHAAPAACNDQVPV